MLSQPKIVIGLTTIPNRINLLEPTLDSLMNQSRKPNKIYLYIANYYKRFDQKFSHTSLPSFLEKYNLQIKFGKDYGPISKLFVALQNEPSNNTFIVTCDDDCLYDKNWLSTLEKGIIKYPNCAIGLRGRKLEHSLNYSKSKCFLSQNIEKDIEVDIVTAVGGWIYQKNLFPPNYIEMWEKAQTQNPFIFFNDDIWISGNLAEKKIKRIVVKGKVKFKTCERPAALCQLKTQLQQTNLHVKLFKKFW